MEFAKETIQSIWVLSENRFCYNFIRWYDPTETMLHGMRVSMIMYAILFLNDYRLADKL